VHQQQGQQPRDLGFVGQQVAQHPGQVHRAAGQLVAHEVLTGVRGVPGGEQQVDDGERDVHPCGQVLRRRHLVRDARRGDLLLRPGQPRRHGGLADQERVRHVRCRHPAHQPQRERDLRLPRQRGVAAGEDQPQPVVADHVGLGFRGRLLRLQQQRQLGLEGLPAAHDVERLAPRDRRQPRPRPVRDTVARPRPQRLHVRVLHRLLGRVQVARHAHRRGEHEGPLAAVRVGDRVLDGAQLSSTTWKSISGRTSTPPS
jgi:hypothetical protein